MKQRMLQLSDKYRSCALIAALLLICNAAFSQNLTNTSAWGYDWNAGRFRSYLAIPSDTLTPPAVLLGSPLMARKNGITYYWNGTRWNSDTASGGTGGGGGVDYLTKQNISDTNTVDATRFWTLQQLSSYTPLSRFLDSMTAARIRYLKSNDTAWLHQQLTILQSNSASNSNLIFSDGLVWSSVDNHVRAQFASPIWDANRIQTYPVSPVVCNGCVPYLDSAARMIKWRLPDSAAVTPIYDSLGAIDLSLYALQNALIDTAHTLRGLLPQYFWAADPLVGSTGHTINKLDTVKVRQSFLDSVRYAIDQAYYAAGGDYVTNTDFTTFQSTIYGSLDSLAALSPSGVDSTKILPIAGTPPYNKTINTYYNNGSTYTSPFIDLTSVGGSSADSATYLTIGNGYRIVDSTAAAIRADFPTGGSGANIMNANLTLDSNREQLLDNHDLHFNTGTTGSFVVGHGIFPYSDYDDNGIGAAIWVNREGGNQIENFVNDYTGGDGFKHTNSLNIATDGVYIYSDRFDGAFNTERAGEVNVTQDGIDLQLLHGSALSETDWPKFIIEGLPSSTDVSTTGDDALFIDASNHVYRKAASGGSSSTAWTDITGKPTTIAGYGITDAFTQSAADALYAAISHTHTFASLTSKPTTLSGYGITDAYPLTGNPSGFLTSASLSGYLQASNNLSDVSNAGTSLTNLGGTTIGKNLFTQTNPGAVTFPRYNADNTVSALTASAFRTAIGAGTGTGDLLSTNNLSDLTSASAARTNLGLGTAATQASTAFATASHTHAESDVTNLVTDLAAKAADNTVVHLSGTETITGNKTFTGSVYGQFANNNLALYSAMGSSIKALTPFDISTNTAFSASTGTMRLLAVYLPQAQTLTGIKWYQSVAGSYTANNENRVGLYSVSGGTLTLVASSANDGTMWTATAGTFPSKAFSSTYAAAPGLYYIGMLINYSAVTQNPIIGSGTPFLNSSAMAVDFTNSLRFSLLATGINTLPTSVTASGYGVSPTTFWAALY